MDMTWSVVVRVPRHVIEYHGYGYGYILVDSMSHVYRDYGVIYP